MTVLYPIPFLIVALIILILLIILIRKKLLTNKNFFRNLLMIFLSISFLSAIICYDFDKNGAPFLYLCGTILIALSITYIKED